VPVRQIQCGHERLCTPFSIDLVEAAGVYVNLYIKGQQLLYRATLQELSEWLDARRFVRVHRSAIVNIESIVQMEPVSHGEFDVLLKNGARTRVSRSYRGQFENRLGQPL